ncbi:MAG: hypothetical protein JNL61_20840 [Rhizobiaceae bacterium]|nr:hypothetical protein [Rhizobiaceae bacterium]
MAAIEFGPRSVTSVIDQYVNSRRSSDRPISMRDALRALRTALPLCALTDRQIVDLVAATAIERGRNIYFDAAPEA